MRWSVGFWVMAFWVIGILAMNVCAAEPDKDAPTAPPQKAAELRIGDLDVSRVLFVGNSLTLHGPAPAIGWTGNWGMAASSAEKDYVHLLTGDIAKAAKGDPQVMVRNLADAERALMKCDVDAVLKDEFQHPPTLVIVELGENVPALSTDDAKKEFSQNFTAFLKRLKQHGDPTMIVRSCFWPDAAKDSIIEKACAEAGGVFVDMSAIGKDPSNAARSERKIEHPGVGAHPGDKGMKAIADALWAAIEKQAGV